MNRDLMTDGKDPLAVNDLFDSFAPLSGTVAPVGASQIDPPLLMKTIYGTDGNDFFHVLGDGRTAPPGYNDISSLTNSGDYIHTGAGNDIIWCGFGSNVIYFDSYLTPRDELHGLGNVDIVVLDGDYSARMLLTNSTLDMIDELLLRPGHDYNFHFDDSVSDGVAFYFVVDGSDLGAGNSLTVNAAAEHNKGYDLRGGAGDDHLTGSQAHDLISCGAGNDTVDANGGNDIITDGSGNDTINGGSGIDLFEMIYGGNDTVTGGLGDDAFDFRDQFDAADRIEGDGGFDTVLVDGGYSGHIVLSSSWMTGIERLQFSAGSHDLAVDDTFLAAGQLFIVETYETFEFPAPTDVFDGSAETDGRFEFRGGMTVDIFTGGAGDDIFKFPGDYSAGDYIGLAPTDRLDGGGGRDTLILDGAGYADGIVFEPATIRNIEVIVLGDNQGNGGSFQHYGFTLDDGNLAAGHTLSLRAQYLNQYGSVAFDGSHETDGNFSLLGGAGTDTLTGGAQADSIKGGAGDDTIQGGLGADKLDGGDGADIFVFSSVLESTSRGFDRLSHFDAANDTFDLPFSVTAIDATVMGGKLSNSGHFDAQLGAAVGPDHLGANHAVLFMPDSGTLRGDIFLVVDGNGVAGYQSGQDLVVLLSSPADLANLSASNFT